MNRSWWEVGGGTTCWGYRKKDPTIPSPETFLTSWLYQGLALYFGGFWLHLKLASVLINVSCPPRSPACSWSLLREGECGRGHLWKLWKGHEWGTQKVQHEVMTLGLTPEEEGWQGHFCSVLIPAQISSLGLQIIVSQSPIPGPLLDNVPFSLRKSERQCGWQRFLESWLRFLLGPYSWAGNQLSRVISVGC